jgi:excisionase family DNA binding protein
VPFVTEMAQHRIELQEAAEQLGVHYQTAYRWVRSGRLAAQMVGGRYLITTEALAEVVDERSTPRPPTTPSRARLDRQAERMLEALTGGDEATAREIARTLTSSGTRLVDLVQTVLVPPLRSIGQAWHDEGLPIWVEHRATAIVERILGELAPNPRGRRRGVAMVAAVSGDRHSLPTAMAALALRDTNWFVHHLGADMPGDELADFCRTHDVDLAVISVTNPDVMGSATAAAELIGQSGPAVIVGRPGGTLDDLLAEVAALTAPRTGRKG